MPFVTFDCISKYNGEFYHAGCKIKVDESDLPALKEMGAEEVDGRTGKQPRKSITDSEE